jgi:hypothetical protein
MYDYGVENMLLTLETRGIEDDPELKLQAGEESVEIKNGAVLHVRLKRMERLVFSVMRNEDVQCIWESELRAGGARTKAWLEAGYADSRRNDIFVHPIGDPVFLTFVHNLEQTPREFTLGGLPAIVLAETWDLVILRDPQPVIGKRTVETKGASSVLNFAEIERKWVLTSETTARLEIHGKGLPRGHWLLLIPTMSPERFALGKGCGRVGGGGDRGSSGGQHLPARSEFQLTCEVRSKGSFPVDVGRFTQMIVSYPRPRRAF